MIDRVYRKWYNNCRWLKCERAGTGRQARLRGVCLWRTGSSPVARTKKGWRNRCHPYFFQYSCGFPGFLGPIFQNRPTVDVQPPKEQKQHKTAFLLLHRKAVFSFFRRRQRNDFRLSVRVVLGFDRGRRRWGLTGSRDGRKDWGAILFFNRNRHFPFFPI